MKNVKTFEKFNLELDEELNEGLFTKKLDFAAQFKTIISYYYKMNSDKNIKYWFQSLLKATHERLSTNTKKKFDYLKPKFAATPGGGVDSNAGEHYSLIQLMEKNPNYFDKTIVQLIDKHMPNEKAILLSKLEIKSSIKEAVVVSELSHIKTFNEL